MDLKNILPEDGPPVSEVNKYIEKYKNDLIVIKYGGNVLIDRNVFNNFITDLFILNKLGLSTVVVHGGGPRIKRELEKSNIQSKFIRGLRVTDKSIIKIVESVLINFNDDILQNLKTKGSEGISIHTKNNNIIEVMPEAKELGFVGIPTKINNVSDIGRFKVVDCRVGDQKIKVILKEGEEVPSDDARLEFDINHTKIYENDWMIGE